MTIEKYYKTHDISEFINELESIDLLCCDELNGKLIDNAVECDTLSAPIKTFLTITEKCNLQCKHCFGSFGKGEELSIKNIEEILETLLYIGIFQISITGGEPLLHKDIINILKLLRMKGFTTQITTNGTIINKEIISFLKVNKMFRFSISIEGDREYHDFIRGKGNFDIILRNIKILQKNNIEVSVNTVLTSKNINDMEKILNILLENNINSISFSHAKPIGEAKKNDYLLYSPIVDRDKIKKVVELVRDFARKTNRQQYLFGNIVTNNGNILSDSFNIKEFTQIGRCGAGSQIMTIKSDGSVVPCIFFDMALDNKINVKSNNILKDNFSDIWNNEYFRYVRKIGINQKCKKCYSFLKDTCNGGCPVNSKYYSGKFDGKDVFCNI